MHAKACEKIIKSAFSWKGILIIEKYEGEREVGHFSYSCYLSSFYIIDALKDISQFEDLTFKDKLFFITSLFLKTEGEVRSSITPLVRYRFYYI